MFAWNSSKMNIWQLEYSGQVRGIKFGKLSQLADPRIFFNFIHFAVADPKFSREAPTPKIHGLEKILFA